MVIWKKIICGILVGAMVTGLAACGSTGGDTVSSGASDASSAVESAPDPNAVPEGMKRLSFTSGTYGITASVIVPEFNGWEPDTVTCNSGECKFVSKGVGEGDSAWDIGVTLNVTALETSDTERNIEEATEKADKYTKLDTPEGITGFAKDDTFTKDAYFYTNIDYLGGNPHVEAIIEDAHIITNGVEGHSEVEDLMAQIGKSLEITVADDVNADGTKTYLFNRSGTIEYPESIEFGGQTVPTVIKLNSISYYGSKEGTLTCEKDGNKFEAVIYESDYTETMFNGLAESTDTDYPYTAGEIAGKKGYYQTINMGGGSTKVNFRFDGGNGYYYLAEGEVNVKEADTADLMALLDEFVKNCKFYSKEECRRSTPVVE